MEVSRGAAAIVAILLVLAPLVGVVAVTPAAASPAGFTGVPDGQIAESGIPDDPNDWLPVTGPEVLERSRSSVWASEHSSSLEGTWAVLNTKTGRYVDDNAVESVIRNDADGKLPLTIVWNLTDDTAHEGRQVTVQADLLRDLYGHHPDIAYGEHEDGTEWTRQIRYEDGFAIWRVPRFSTNTITFDGTVRLTGTPSNDGDQFTYDLGDLDSADNFTIDVTGNTAAMWDNVSDSGVSLSSSQSLSVGGNLQPTNGSGGDPELAVTAHAPTNNYSPYYDNGDGTSDGSEQFVGDTNGDAVIKSTARIEPDFSGDIDEITVNIESTSGSDYGATVDVRIASGGVDSTYGEGTLVKSGWDPAWSTGNQTITLDSTYSVTSGNTYEVEFITGSSDGGGDYDQLQLDYTNPGAIANNWWYDNQGTATDVYPAVVVTENQQVNSLSVDDNSGKSVTFGSMTDGETTTKSFDLDTGSSALDWSGSGGGTVDYTLTMEERTQTDDPSVEVNGNWTNSTGALSDGSTTSLTTDTAWLSDQHTNRVNISVGDGTLSADAPTAQVDVDYIHDSVDDQSVSINDDAWTERYNVSKTYSATQQNANLTIPFVSSVYNLGAVQYRINESGGWTSASTTDYQVAGNDLDVDLDGIYGGDIPATTTMEVKANGTKVHVNNGEISVEEATTAGNDLDSKIKLVTWNSDSYIEVNDTGQSAQVHYANSESWSGADEYARFTADTQELYLPQASASSTFRARTLPVEASVERPGEVRIEVENPSTTEPEFVVTEGSSGDDSVSYTFVDAADGQYYELYSQTTDNIRDAGTASSPLTLDDDDSNETLIFREAVEGGSSTGGAGGGGGGQVLPEPSGPDIPLIILALGGVLLVVGIVQWRTDINPISATGSGARDAGSMLAARPKALAALLGIAVVGSIALGIVTVPESVLVVLVVGAVAVVGFFGLKRTGNFSLPVFALLVGGTGFAALVATGQLTALFDVIGTPGTVALVGGLVYVLYKYVQRRTQRREVNLTLRGD